MFDNIVGQDRVKEALSISIKAANCRNKALPHCIIEAQAGLGKTMFSRAIADELGVNMRTILGGNIHSFKDLLPTILNMDEREVLFIDEIHRVNSRMAESFYTILEDSRVDYIVKDADGKPFITSIDLPKFTILGATTEIGKLSKPFIDRFKLRFTLDLYSIESIIKLIEMDCAKLMIDMTDDAIEMLAKVSRGTPRIAKGLLEWVGDYRTAKSINCITCDDLAASLTMRGIGLDGSTKNDRKYLDFLGLQNGAIGLSTIAASIGIDRDTIETVVEPYLLSRNMIKKTNKGRMLV